MRSMLMMAVALAACSDAALPDMPVRRAAHVDTADSQVAELQSDAQQPPADAGRTGDAQVVLDLPDAATWLAADDFSIRLQESTCLGVCKGYWVQIDAGGHVAYRGAMHVAKPGFFELKVPEADAKALRSALIDAGFLGLRDSYTSTEHGCKSLITDAPTYTFTLRTPEREKQVVWYLGCVDLPVRKLLRSIEEQIVQATTVGRFLYPSPRSSGCRVPRTWVDKFVLANGPNLDKTDYGILHFGETSTWSVTTCDGEQLATGEYTEHANWERVLLPASSEAASFSWPGVDKPQGVGLINSTGLPSWITVTLNGLLDERQQWAYEGDTCGAEAP